MITTLEEALKRIEELYTNDEKSDNSRAADVIRNWLRNRSTLEFLSTWEEIYNPDFKVFEFDHFKIEAGLPIIPDRCSEKLFDSGMQLSVGSTVASICQRGGFA